VSSLSPVTGPITGGTDVTLHGTGFVPGHTVVYFGSLAVTNVDVVSPTTLRVVAPAAVDVLRQAHSAASLHGLSTAVEAATPAGRSAPVPSVRFTYL
jgi:hypothetical protein